jgi:DNA mismatch repair protein MutL
MTLTTRKRGAEDPLVVRVRVFAGEVVESATAAHPPGTTVEARDLFLNLPVRRGFLGTVRAEAGSVATTAAPAPSTRRAQKVFSRKFSTRTKFY